jgi:hypothetical protein
LIAAVDKPISDNPRDWLFQTSVKNVWASFCETWLRESRGDYSLSNWALTLYVSEGPLQNVEAFAVHCEPQYEGIDLTSRCKRLPHVHIKTAKYELGHAHIPLHLLGMEDALFTIDSLTSFMENTVELADKEVLRLLGAI